jgi:FkbM family methyltransferase
MIQTFDELVEIAASASTRRLNKTDFRDARMFAGNSNKNSIKSFLVKFRFLRYAKTILNKLRHGSSIDDDYAAVHIYSQTLTSDFNTHTEEYRQSYELLSDDHSRRAFLNLLAGEMLLDTRYGIPFAQLKNGKSDYYIADDLPSGEPFFQAGETFVDCGAYTGDTLQEFIDAGLTPKKYFGFEPDPKNFREANERLTRSGVDGVVYNAAVYKEKAALRFAANLGGISQLNEDGGVSVQALSIDDTIKEPVTMIKMDVEGGECDALEGAAVTIKEHKPKLAICVYHKHTDFRTIPLLIKRLNAGYSEFYMRYLSCAYSGKVGFAEVVLFVR